MVLVLMIPQATAYADGDADFNGQGAPVVWQYDTVNVRAYGYDAFGNAMKDMVPGDVASVSVRLRNNTSDQVAFRLACNPVTGASAQALEPYFVGKTADDSLLDVITIEVRHGATPIYSGTLRGIASAGSSAMYETNGVSLGTVSAGYSGIITVDLSVPVTLDSSAMNTLCAIEWHFIATQYNDPANNPVQTGVGGTTTTTTTQLPGATAGTPPVLDDTPTANLPDTPQPGVPGEPNIDIDTTPVPQAPGLGANAWALYNLLLTFLAALQLIWLIIRRILAKNREEEHTSSSQATENAYIDMRMKRKLAAALIGIVGTIAAVVLFLLTENMRLPMEYVNKYTICYILVNLVEFAFFLISIRKRAEEKPQS